MFFVGPLRDFFSQLKKRKQIFILQNSKFCRIRKSPDDIHTSHWLTCSCVVISLNWLSFVPGDIGTIVHTHISLSCSFLNSLRYTKAEQQEAIRTCSQWVKNIYRFVFEFWSTDFFYSTNLIRRALGKAENLGVPVLFGGHNLSPLVEIGLYDLPKSGGAMACPTEKLIWGWLVYVRR